MSLETIKHQEKSQNLDTKQNKIKSTEQVSEIQEKVRAMIFVESFLGYGHFNIVDLLSKELQNLGAEVAITSSTLDLCGTSFNFGNAKKYNLPPLIVNSKSKHSTPDGIPFKNNITGPPEYYRQQISEATTLALQEFQPSIIVYELFPFVMHWRTASSNAVNQFYSSNHRPETISLCRDIIHSNSPERVLEQLSQDCSRIMIRSDSQFAKLEESQPEWANIELPIEYVGNFLSNQIENHSNNAPKENRVVIFGGGGYHGSRDAKFYLETASSRPFSKTLNNSTFTIIKNSGVPDSLIDSIKQSTENKIEILPPIDSDNFKQMISQSAAVITRGGYNTTFELVALGTPFTVIPRSEKEQLQRAKFLERAGLCSIIPEENLTAQTVASTLDSITAPKPPRKNIPFSFTGATQMAQRLLELGQDYEQKIK